MQRALGGQHVFLRNAVDYRGERVFAVTEFLTGTGWGLVVKMDRAEVLSDLQRIRFATVVAVGLMLLLVLLIYLVLSRLISQPMRELVQQLDAVHAAEGMERPLRGDETRLLAQAVADLEQRLAGHSPMPVATAPGPEADAPPGSVGELRELERLRAETERQLEDVDERLQLVIEGSVAGIWEWRDDDPDRIQLSSRCYELLAGAPSTLEVTPPSFFSFVHPEDRQRVQAEADEVMRIRQQFDTELRLRRYDGEYRWFQMRAAVVWPEEGDRPQRVVGSIEDINDRKRAEKVNVQLMAEMERRATQDALTGLYNRGYFNERTANEIRRSSRSGVPFSLMILDGDHFKSVNDTYGHVTGDQVLKALSKCILENERETDVACRFGGEEFTICLPDTDETGAFNIAERVREAIESLQLVSEDGRHFNVTASIGVAEWRPGEDVDALVMRADAAVYHSKHNGRNRVTAASELEKPTPETAGEEH